MKYRIFILSMFIMIMGTMASGKELAPVKINLKIEVTQSIGNPRVLAILIFKNESHLPIEIAKFLVGEGKEPSNSFFQITSGHKNINYIGEMAKRAPPKKTEFLSLNPNQEIQGIFDISKSYKWLPEESEYQISYMTFNHFSKSLINLKSEQTNFRLQY